MPESGKKNKNGVTQMACISELLNTVFDDYAQEYG